MKSKFRTFHFIASLAILLFTGNLTAWGQLQVTQLPGTSQQQAQKMVQTLVGSGVQTFNAQLTGGSGFQASAGLFKGFNSNIGLDSGVILTSGLITGAPGNSTTLSSDPGTGITNDPQLAAAASVPVSDIKDVSALEFDLIPTGDTLTFRYVFGSEEYTSFTCTQFNDVFGFFITGPGITTNIGVPGVRNIALIKDQLTNLQIPVTINTVNSGSCSGTNTPGPGVSLSNSVYFVDNTPGFTVTYDGFTVVLTAQVLVQRCKTYHLKLAIADVVDAAYDSGVFIEAGSLQTTDVVFESQTEVELGSYPYALEGCVNGGFVFTRPVAHPYADTIKFVVEGSATNGVDYVNPVTNSAIDNYVVIQAGDTSAVLKILPVQDINNEPQLESIVLRVLGVCAAGTQSDTVSLIVQSDFLIEAREMQDDTVVCPNEAVQLDVIGTVNKVDTAAVPAVKYKWRSIDDPSVFFSNDSIRRPVALLQRTGRLEVTATINQCTRVDTLTITVQTGPADPAGPDKLLCLKESINLEGYIGADRYFWTQDSASIMKGIAAFKGPRNIPNPIIEFTDKAAIGDTAVFYLTLEDSAECVFTDSVNVIFNIVTEITNVITPNNDGRNDKLEINGLCQGSTLEIFNRWGSRVYNTKDYKNDWKAEGVPAGTYYYYFRNDKVNQIFKGWLEVIR